MDINTGKLVSNSTSLYKQVKKNDLNENVSKLEKIKNDSKTNQIFTDFNDIKLNNKSIKEKLTEINNLITQHENELSKIQFIEQKIEILEGYNKKNDRTNIDNTISNSIFKGEAVLKEYFTSANEGSLDKRLEEVKNKINEKYYQLDKDYKAIEITYQNLISLYSHDSKNPQESMEKINFKELLNTTNLNKKRVMDLIL